MTTAHFSSRARTQRSRSAASRGSLYFAWGCFRDFLSRPCRAPPKGRYAGSGTVPRAYWTNRSSSNTSCSRLGGGPETSPCQQRAKRPCGFAYRTPWNSGDASALLRLDAGGADHPAPFFGFLRDQLAELGGRARERLAADGGKPRLHSGVGDRRIDFLVELVDDFNRRVAGRADAIPLACFITRHEIRHRLELRQHFRARARCHRECAQLAGCDVLGGSGRGGEQ